MRIRLAVLFALAALPLAAHHSFGATYDENKPVTLEGLVTKILWRNPHSFLSLDVTDADGTKTTWDVELQAAGSLFANGWSKASVKEGDRVTVRGARGKGEANRAAAFSLTLPDGRALASNPRTWGIMGVKP